jgi:ADP-ribose pyrophosphatase
VSDFDPEDAVRRYRARVATRPDLFVNPPGSIYEILLDPVDIAAAQAAAADVRRAHGMPAADTRVGVLAEDPYLDMLRDAVRFPDGSLGLYNRLIFPPGVVILPVYHKKVVLIYRFRHGPRDFVYEVPRGMVSPGSSFENAAREELEEEIGATPRELVPLGDYHSNTGIVHETMKLFVAHIDGVGTPSRHEAIERIELMPVDQVEALIRDGIVTDAATLAVYLRAKLGGQLG